MYVNLYIPTQTPEEDNQVAICKHQANSPFNAWPDLVIYKQQKGAWTYTTLDTRPGIIKGNVWVPMSSHSNA